MYRFHCTCIYSVFSWPGECFTKTKIDFNRLDLNYGRPFMLLVALTIGLSRDVTNQQNLHFDSSLLNKKVTYIVKLYLRLGLILRDAIYALQSLEPDVKLEGKKPLRNYYH